MDSPHQKMLLCCHSSLSARRRQSIFAQKLQWSGGRRAQHWWFSISFAAEKIRQMLQWTIRFIVHLQKMHTIHAPNETVFCSTGNKPPFPTALSLSASPTYQRRREHMLIAKGSTTKIKWFKIGALRYSLRRHNRFRSPHSPPQSQQMTITSCSSPSPNGLTLKWNNEINTEMHHASVFKIAY